MAGVPFVTTYHGIYGEHGAAKRLYNSVMARGDVVIANSHYTAAPRSPSATARRRDASSSSTAARTSRASTPMPSARTRRHALRKAWGLRGTERIVLNLARLTGWKGQSVLVEAAALPPLAGRDDVVVVLAGDEQGRGGYRRELEERDRGARAGRARAHRRPLRRRAGRIRASPTSPSSPRPSRRRSAGRPSRRRRWACRSSPTALGAAPETVLAPPEVDAALRTGWHVPPNEPQALSAAIGEALALTPAERQALAGRARAHAARFSVEAMCAATLAVYDRLCCAPATRTAPKPAKNRRELTRGRNFPDSPQVRWQLEAGAAYIYFRQQRKEK